MPTPTLFEYLKHINEPGGNPLLLDDPDAYRGYNPFIISRGVAQSKDTIMYAQMLNQAVVTDKEMHYAFLFNSVRKVKRYAKWSKKEEQSEDLLLVQRVYQVNIERAASFLELLTPQELQLLREHDDKGGQMSTRGKKS